jgi:hypothetical protein
MENTEQGRDLDINRDMGPKTVNREQRKQKNNRNKILGTRNRNIEQ